MTGSLCYNNKAGNCYDRLHNYKLLKQPFSIIAKIDIYQLTGTYKFFMRSCYITSKMIIEEYQKLQLHNIKFRTECT